MGYYRKATKRWCRENKLKARVMATFVSTFILFVFTHYGMFPMSLIPYEFAIITVCGLISIVIDSN